MSEKEIEVLIDLIDREINNYISVKNRVNKKEDWEKRIIFLEDIREKLKTKIEYEKG